MSVTHKKQNDDKWDDRELGASEKFVRRTSKEREKNLDDNLGLQSISIRLQKNLLDDLKELSEADGMGYQPYVRQVLMRHVRDEKVKSRKQM